MKANQKRFQKKNCISFIYLYYSYFIYEIQAIMEGMFMSFENGYNIEEYIGNTIEAYERDKRIFDKALNILNVFMQRNDWPMCYNEFEKVAKDILKGNPEGICRSIGMFRWQDPALNSNLIDWDKSLHEEFKNDIFHFTTVMQPIIEGYYSYTNNPLGISNIIEMENYSPLKIIRIQRNDGKNIDLRLSNYEIEKFISTLNGLIGER
jgi:hypothetical protein